MSASKPLESQEEGNALASHPTQEETRPTLHWRTWAVVIACHVAYGTQIYSYFSLAFWLTYIIQGVGGADKQIWLPTIAQILLAAFGLPVSWISDIVGRRYFGLGACALSFVGSIVQAKSNNIGTMIIGCAITFVGWAVGPLYIAIAAEVLPKRWRPIVQGSVQAASAVGAFLTIFAGGGFIANKVGGSSGFRWLFWLQAILYGIAFVIFLFLYRPIPRPNMHPEFTKRQQLLKFDFLGAILLVGFLVPLIMAVTWLYSPFPASNPHVFAPIVVSGICVIVLAGWWWKGTSTGLLPHRVVSKRNIYICALLTVLEGWYGQGFNVFFSLQTTIVFEHRPFIAGLHLLPVFCSIFVAAPLYGLLFQKFRRPAELMASGWIFFVAGVAGLAVLSTNQSGAQIGIGAVIGIGFGCVIALALVIALLDSPPDLLGTTAALILVSRSLGAAIGAPVLNAIFVHKIGSKLPAYIAGAVLPLGVSPDILGSVIGLAAAGNVTGLLALPGITLPIATAALQAVSQAYMDSFKYCFLSLIPIASIGVILSFFLKRPVRQLSYHIDVPAEELALTKRAPPAHDVHENFDKS